jgi:hypothetical protein
MPYRFSRLAGCFAGALLLSAACFAAPSLAPELAKQVPSGWRVEQITHGDLNLDGVEDAALTLRQNLADLPKGGQDQGLRQLLILFGAEKGWRRGDLSTKVLWCAQCYGASAPPEGGTPEVTIKKGVLLVDQESGSRESHRVLARFRWDPPKGKFRLIGRDVMDRDRLSGDAHGSSLNYLTGAGVLTHVRHDEKSGKDKISDRKVKKKLEPVFLDQYDDELLDEQAR